MYPSLVLCVIYYFIWTYVLPHIGKYTIRQETIVLDNEGTNTHRLVKVPNHELAAWDATHDATGKAVGEVFVNNNSNSDVEKHE
jgi:hypothetical protein